MTCAYPLLFMFVCKVNVHCCEYTPLRMLYYLCSTLDGKGVISTLYPFVSPLFLHRLRYTVHTQYCGPCICTCIILCYNTVKFILFMFKSYGKCSISTLTLYYLSSPISKPSRVLQKRLLDKQQDTATKKAKLATSIAYKHSSVVPRDVDVQNFRIFVGRLKC